MTLAQRVSAFLNPPTKADLGETKAAFGPGAWVMENHEPLSRHRRDAQKWMKTAQAISRRNPWVNTAEGIISGKLSTVPWHLEDANGDTLDEDHQGSPAAQAAIRLLERPNPQMTRSKLWAITLRHMGVCGNAFWYLDQRDLLAGTPLQILYINPARMRPATDKQGNLTGWVLDADDTYEFEQGRQTGIGLKLEEVIHFTLEPPDWGYLGHGLVEAAENLLSLNSAAERYLIQTLSSGGRRGHFIGPKDGRMDDEVFQSLVAGLRNVAESPDAAKRNIVTKGPLEVHPQAATPNEVGAQAVLTEMREDIVSGVWKVPLSQLGVPLPAGLNSGDSRKWEEASLWQNAIEPRAKPFAETIQFQLLDRFEALGAALSLVLETPTFDDAAPAWDLLEKSKDAPITWNDQRTLVGLDPLPDYDAAGNPLGIRITMSSKIVTVAAGADETGKAPAIDEPEPPAPIVSLPNPALLEPGTKAAPLSAVRSSLEQSLTPQMRKAIASFLDEQKGELVKRLRDKAGHLLKKPADLSWWSGKFWDERLAKLMAPHLEAITVKVGTSTAEVLDKPQKADPDFIEAALAFIQKRSGDRITGINETTRDAVLTELRDALEEAVEDGMGPEEAADLIGERVSNLAVWGEARSDLISRTELMNVYNDAALRSYQNYDVRFVQALDGDKDAECAARDGKEYPIDDAFSISDHPNGTLDWAPVVGKAVVIRELAA